MFKRLLLLAFLAIALLPAIRYLRAQEAVTGAEQASDQNVDRKKVVMVNEAKVPAGFPPVTAVGEIAVKDYPVYRAAKVDSQSNGRNRMFRTLFNHIKSNSIAMTSPVEMTYDSDGPTSMAFLYGSTEIGEVGKGDEVEVRDVPAMKVVSIGVRGSYNQENFEANRKKLVAWLEANSDQWKATGPARHFAFNSPFVPNLMKYAEVQIPIESVEASEASAN